MAEMNAELVTKVENLKRRRDENAAELQVYNKQKEGIEAEIKALGFEPATVDESVRKMAEFMTKTEAELMPKVLEIESKLSTSTNAQHVNSNFNGFQ